MSTQGDGAPAGVQGPPYPPQHQGLGETPTILPDVPVNAVFLALFVFAAASHMTLFQINMHKRGKKFVFNAAIFGFCLTRIGATSLRIAWANHQHNVALGMAAQIFVYAGVVILFITNLFFAQRIVRAQHPQFGWSKPFSVWLPIILVIMVLTILMLISAVIVQFFIPSAYAQEWTRDIQLYGATFYGFAAFLPIPIILISALIKSRPTLRTCATDNFGITGSMKSKILIVLFTSVLLSLGAWYRAGTSLLSPTPTRSAKPWYFSKARFYIFNFGIEIFVTLFYFFIRIDKRYIIPDGAKGPFSYGNGFVFAGEEGYDEEKREEKRDSQRPLVAQLNRMSTAPTEVVEVDGYMTPSTLRSAKRSHVSWGGRTMTSSEFDFGGWEPTVAEETSEADFQHEPLEQNYDLECDSEDLRSPLEVSGTEHELGYNTRTGRWERRAIARSESRSRSRSRKSRRSSKRISMLSRLAETKMSEGDMEALPDANRFTRPEIEEPRGSEVVEACKRRTAEEDLLAESRSEH